MENLSGVPERHSDSPIRVNLERPESPAPSYQSMMSDLHESDAEPGDKPAATVTVQVKKAESLGSLKSVGSHSQPVIPGDGVFLPEQGLPLDKQSSLLPPLDTPLMGYKCSESEDGEKSMELPFIFKSILSTVSKLFRDELIMFKHYLTTTFSEYFENQMDDCEDALDVVDKMLERCGKGCALKIATHILRDLKQYDLVKFLEKNCIRVRLQYELKVSLKRRYGSIFEGIPRQGEQCFLSCVYVDQLLTEGRNAGVNGEHELRGYDASSRGPVGQETEIGRNDIFGPSPSRDRAIRTVLTTGIAGIGMTVSVQRFILDWIEEKANQEIHFVFPLPFRELGLVKEDNISLMELICVFFPEMKEMDFIERKDCRVLFILDGLDGCRLPLDFRRNDSVNDVRQKVTLDALLTNLVRGNLVPSALLWITSRSAAANRIPPQCIQRCTELRGFNASQKEAYFRKKFKDPNQAAQILSHINTFASLEIMCHIPVFCWVVATIFERKFSEASRYVNTKVTQFYTHYLILQTHMKNLKYYPSQATSQPWLETDPVFVCKLAELAFRQLEKESAVFYEEDLRQMDVDVQEVTLRSGLCTEIFKQEISQDREFCFVHLSVQEYLAALHVHLSYVNHHKNLLNQPLVPPISRLFKETSMFGLYKAAVDKVLHRKDGHLDLFLRFLLGLSQETTQQALEGLIPRTGSFSHNPEETARYIQKMLRENSNLERCRNLPHCLDELKCN
ncbi:NLR family CARD domain-containing protein 3-like isoform X3 [Scleropages formosus]|uniref:NLR family CARD domain-containing protein 3-like isoform X3 n=1 Tax=Scleropages formosus TaxID=113540 RepID=UPI0008790353|nr:NLR family CARD domain-containing protein 3-like isoform X3 [Scleropages formosus]